MKNKIAKMISALVVVAMIAAVFPMVTAAEEPQDTLILGMQDDAANLCWFDPDTNDVWKTNILGWNFETLMAYTPDFELYPVLALPGATDEGAEYTADASGLNITFELREGVTFTDGTPMTATDVAFSYQVLGWGLYQTQIMTPLLWTDATFDAWDGGTTHIGVEAVDDNTVIFHLNGPYSMFWYATLGVPIIPSHVWEDHIVAIDDAMLDDFEIPGATESQPDYSYGADNSEKDATIGTGPWMLNYWTQGVGAQIDVYDGYWGTNETITWADVEYPLFPQYLRHIQFKQYGALDVAILALKKGEIHFIPWNIGSGFYNSLKTDPNIGFQIPQDQGFFYTSFNFRKAPMNDLDFRKVVAYCTDKDYIVNRLMGGYGTKGTVPMAITNPFYINNTVPDHVANFNLQAAEDLLDDAGYDDINSDGWRENVDGSPLKISILTPPKDYDPVRADAGIMISKNLKSLGINAESAPTSFDTIVSKAYVSYDFDIYILGWSVGSFPENYLLDFFHSDYDVAVNPAGSNAAGYNNPTADAMMDEMLVTMDNTVRAKMVKDICGIIMEELPYNVLYYRKNIEAFRQSTWQGWLPAFGTVYNGFSLNSLHPPTGGGGSVTPPAPVAGELYARVSLPSNVLAEGDVAGSVYVSQDGMPVNGASVEITSSYDATVIVKTTNANGYANFTDTVPFQSGTASYSVFVESGTKNATAYGETTVIIPPSFNQVNVSAEPPVVAAGADSDVTVTVVDQDGNGVAGVDVYVDTNVMLGAVDDEAKTTNATGVAVFTYTAPVDPIINTNLIDIFKANISVANMLVPEVQQAAIGIGVENPDYDWAQVDVTSVSAYVLDSNATTAQPNETMVWVNVKDFDGVGINAMEVTMELSTADANITVPDATKNTNATGMVNFTIHSETAEAQEFTAIFTVGKAYSTVDTVQLCVVNDSLLANNSLDMFAADVDFDLIAGPDDNIQLTVTVYNKTAQPVNDTAVNMFIPFVSAGVPAHFDDGVYAWYAGDELPNPYDVANNLRTDVAGKITVSMTTSSFKGDFPIAIQMAIGDDLYPADEALVEYLDAGLTIYDAALLQRAPVAVMSSFEMSSTYMSMDSFTTTVTMGFSDVNGALVGSDIQIYNGKGGAKSLQATIATDGDGMVSRNYVAARSNSDATLYMTGLVHDSAYAIGMYNPDVGDYEGGFPFEPAMPYLATSAGLSPLIVSGEASVPLTAVGGAVDLTVEVTDIFGNAVEDAMVYVGTTYGATDENGTAVLTVVAASEGINVYTVSAVKGTNTGSIQLSTFGGVAHMVFSAPTYPVNVTKGAAATIGVTVTNSGPVSGDAVVDLTVDGTVVSSKVVNVAAGGTQAVSFAYVYTGTANTTVMAVADQAAVTLNVITPAVVTPDDGDEGYSMLVVAGAAVAMLVVGLLIGWLVLGKMMGGSKPAAAKPAPKPAPKPAGQPAPKEPEQPKIE